MLFSSNDILTSLVSETPHVCWMLLGACVPVSGPVGLAFGLLSVSLVLGLLSVSLAWEGGCRRRLHCLCLCLVAACFCCRSFAG